MKVDKIVQEQLTKFASDVRQSVAGDIGIVIVVGQEPRNQNNVAMGLSVPGWSREDQYQVMISIASTANALLKAMSNDHCELVIQSPAGFLSVGKTQDYHELHLGKE